MRENEDFGGVSHAAEGGGHCIPDTHQAGASPALEDLCDEMRAHHRRRLYLIKVKNSIRLQLGSFIRFNVYGYSTFDEEKDRKKIEKQSDSLIAAVEKGKMDGVDQEAFDAVSGLIAITLGGVAPFESAIKEHDKALEKLGKQLPVWDAWAKDVKGLGAKSLAMIIGETGNLDNYANPGKVWKRLGLAVNEWGKRQGAPDKTSDKAEMKMRWIGEGYNPSRRSVSWQAMDSLFKAQLSRVDEETGEFIKPLGPYGEVYHAKKSDYMARVEAGDGKWTKARADKAARRYTEKRVLKHLWRAWRGQVWDDDQESFAPTPPT